MVKSGGNWVTQTVDNLAFSYADTKTNRINSIADASNNTLGYIPNNGAYSYDGNGNTTFDPSRGLTLTNNFLNLPSKFTKADGSKQEVIYDATSHKWQEKTYAANNGILLAQKTHLENMEFEGNELSLIHHPTGFVRKLNSANHLSGTQNGDAQGKTITSTQKIGDGRYTAIDQVTLLPGFEATAKDAFLAKIGSVSTYQWQYVLKDHLGNQRALFTDKNGDGLLQQSTDENSNEVLALRNYSAFGLELGGSNQNINYQNPYKYTGKEENSFTGYYDFGARWADPTIGNRFLQLDEYAAKYYSISPYSYVANRPLCAVDPDGKKIIFVNGLIFAGSPPAGSQYWGGYNSPFVLGAQKFFNDYQKPFFSNQSYRKLSSASERYDLGWEYAKQNLKKITEDVNLKNDKIRIVSHSMGGAFALGIKSYLEKMGYKVETAIFINTKQGGDLMINENDPTTIIDYQTFNDPVINFTDIFLGTSRNIKGADYRIAEMSDEEINYIHRQPIDNSRFWQNLLNQLWNSVPDNNSKTFIFNGKNN